MFKLIGEPKTIHKSRKLYLAFPDILQSKEDPNRIFLVYRSGEQHHPTVSLLHFWISEDKGKTWTQRHEIPMNMKKDGRVWNCPRLSYFPDGSLNIICDSKDSTNERKAIFNTHRVISHDDGMFFSSPKNIGIDGMLPDHVVNFKGNMYIANHLNDTTNQTLVQFTNCSRDKGKTWYDRNIMGRESRNFVRNATPKFYCEASILNYRQRYMLSFVRDNARGPQPIYCFRTIDGLNWQSCGHMPIYGHRPTVLFDQNEENRVFMSYRDTQNMSVAVSSFIIDDYGSRSNIETIQIEKEKKCNLFNFGYTGLVEYEKNKFMLTYYITKGSLNPYIKTAKLVWK